MRDETHYPPLHGLLFPISSMGLFICTIPQTGLYIPQSLLLQLWSTGWNKKHRSDDPLHHEQMLDNSHISLLVRNKYSTLMSMPQRCNILLEPPDINILLSQLCHGQIKLTYSKTDLLEWSPIERGPIQRVICLQNNNNTPEVTFVQQVRSSPL